MSTCRADYPGFCHQLVCVLEHIVPGLCPVDEQDSGLSLTCYKRILSCNNNTALLLFFSVLDRVYSLIVVPRILFIEPISFI